jgi:hypothetical protein
MAHHVLSYSIKHSLAGTIIAEKYDFKEVFDDEKRKNSTF